MELITADDKQFLRLPRYPAFRASVSRPSDVARPVLTVDTLTPKLN